MWSLRRCLMVAAAGVFVAGAPTVAAEESPGEAAVVSASVGPAAGIRRLRPETWGLVGLNVLNGGDQPADVLATMYFSGDPSFQYARQLWVPARSKRYSWCPLFPPSSTRPQTPESEEMADTPAPTPELTQAEVKSLLFDRSGSGEEFVRDGAEPLLGSRLLPIHHGRMTTAVVTDSGAGGPPDTWEDHDAIEVVLALRESAELSPAVVDLYEDFLPPVEESLDGLDQLVLASDRLADDAAARRAVRRWLLAGGRLWIMLDRVEPETVELLLGEAFRCRVVDRVGLTRVVFEGFSRDAGGFTGPPRDFEQPVDLVRVLAADAEVIFKVGGWPAAFWQRVGRGDVLFTTLGAAGWVSSSGGGPLAVATKPLEFLGLRLTGRRDPPLVEPGEWEAYLTEQIGYRIAGRGFVIRYWGRFAWLSWRREPGSAAGIDWSGWLGSGRLRRRLPRWRWP